VDHDQQLTPGGVHVWRTSTDVSESELARLQNVLSEDEQDRASRFRFDQHRRRFIAGRAILREILASYLGQAPARLQFALGEYEKPSLLEANDIHFNLSHTGNLTVYAVTRGQPVGVDVESVRPFPDALEIAERFFSRLEYSALSALPESDRARAFLISWARKEAYLKATGQGLSLDTKLFSISVFPDPPALIHADESLLNETNWTFSDLLLGPRYVGSVARQGAIEKLVLRDWVR
jgi:4'-phosphopantetheinyl transferase